MTPNSISRSIRLYVSLAYMYAVLLGCELAAESIFWSILCALALRWSYVGWQNHKILLEYSEYDA